MCACGQQFFINYIFMKIQYIDAEPILIIAYGNTLTHI